VQRANRLRRGPRIVIVALVVACAVTWFAFTGRAGRAFGRIASVMGSHVSIRDRLEEHGDAVRARCEPPYRAVEAAWPPQRLCIVGYKRERRLDVHARDEHGAWRVVGSYPVLAASGELGPKLAEGDRQVPEGVYALASLNPNSRFHLALRVDYPNSDDRERARADGRANLGGDIMIHGGASSIGCLAIGDTAIEDVFVAAASCGIENVTIVLAPYDLRGPDVVEPPTTAPPWTNERWRVIRSALNELSN